ncbi:MAG: type IV pilus modification PilV family protein [Nitrospirales bacterium]
MFCASNLPHILTANRGASLLEILIAMVLVSIAILGVAGFSTVSIKGTAFSQELTIAVTLAQDALEELRREGYRSTAVGVVTNTEPYGSIAGAPLFQRTVVTKANTPARGLQTVMVNVAWDDDAHSTSLSTILAE